MNIVITEILPAASKQYPYTHRVEVSADALASDKVSEWLDKNDIPHTQTGWGVYYLNKKYATMLTLRWS